MFLNEYRDFPCWLRFDNKVGSSVLLLQAALLLQVLFVFNLLTGYMDYLENYFQRLLFIWGSLWV